jgi:ABC-type transport system involved in cytochrome c biogenesis permease subunit
LLSAFNSFLLCFISIKLSEDGNIKSVVAVLNTNFWLIIHVLTISVGYGLCLIAGFLSHFYLYQILNKKYLTHKNNLYNYIFYITLLALLFSFVGTLLGGIWADQSWGRFWGWDPKENGALLIVLWLTLILHAKFSNLISEINFIIGVFLNLIVLSLAWFGVNLLSVGLHSYGFIENIGIGLFIYITFEIFLLILIKKIQMICICDLKVPF